MWERLRGALSRDAVVWLRSCKTFNGTQGREAAAQLLRTLDVAAVVGHTVIIHAVHGGLQVLRRGQEPHWADGSGDGSVLATDTTPPV